MSRKGVRVFTDGAVSVQGGPGGWAAILLYGKTKKEISGTLAATSNQRAELVAVINALFRLKRSTTVEVHTDSKYIVDAFNKGWINRWIGNGWKNSSGEPVANREEWETLLALTNMHAVVFLHVRGHAGNHYNEHADKLAKKAAKEAVVEYSSLEPGEEPDNHSPNLTIKEAALQMEELLTNDQSR